RGQRRMAAHHALHAVPHPRHRSPSVVVRITTSPPHCAGPGPMVYARQAPRPRQPSKSSEPGSVTEEESHMKRWPLLTAVLTLMAVATTATPVSSQVKDTLTVALVAH